jgi:hypothetical protein
MGIPFSRTWPLHVLQEPMFLLSRASPLIRDLLIVRGKEIQSRNVTSNVNIDDVFDDINTI